MNPLRLLGTVFFVLWLAGCSGKDKKEEGKTTTAQTKEKTNAEKIVGKWKVIKVTPKGDVGALVEFTADGKITSRFEDEKPDDSKSAKYKVEGDKLTVSYGDAGKEKSETDTIKTLNDTTLITTSDKGEREFQRQK